MDLRNLKYILKPSFWSLNDPYNEEWDIELNWLMNNYKFVYATEHYAKLGDREIWIANYPYACFYPWPQPNIKYRPSRLTIEKARKKLINDLTITPKISGYFPAL